VREADALVPLWYHFPEPCGATLAPFRHHSASLQQGELEFLVCTAEGRARRRRPRPPSGADEFAAAAAASRTRPTASRAAGRTANEAASRAASHGRTGGLQSDPVDRGRDDRGGRDEAADEAVRV
jgi:hypothetical protein